MKKLLVTLLVLLTTLSLLVSCSQIKSIFSSNDNQSDADINDGNQNTNDDNNNPDSGETPDDQTPDEGTKPEDKPDPEPSTHLHTDFTNEEKDLFNEAFGFVIPFAPNDEYYIEEVDYAGVSGYNFYTYGNTSDEYEAYRAIIAANYEFVESYVDDFDDTWYTYSHNDVLVDLCYYTTEDGAVLDVFIYIELETAEDFSDEEKQLFLDTVGLVIPFLPSADYVVEAYAYEGETGVNFYTFDNIPDEFYEYMELFDDYTLVDSYEDDYGDRWYTYQKDNVYVDMSCYLYDEAVYVVDVYAYVLTGSGDGSYNYTDFTSEEKSLLTSLIGTVIPFIPNNGYNVDEYSYENEKGVNYYTFGNTAEDFSAYRALYSSWTFVESYEDEYGDTWYVYQNGDVYVDMCHYYYDGEYVVDIYAYVLTGDGDDIGGGDVGGGDVGGGDTDTNVITNAGAGLPEDSDGVYDVDFTEAENVKDVTDQGYYLDGCPTTGSPAVLVIPVDFSDVTANSKGYTTNAIVNAFMGGAGTTDYYSVHDYYYISSYGTLDLDITVLDYWFRPQYNSEYYANATYDYYGSEIAIGDQLIINEALAYLESIMDLSQFDSDDNGIIDAVVLINTLDIGEEDFYWAYRYWNVYTNDEGYYYEYDGVSANDYLWASYQFLYESYDEDGNAVYDEPGMNTYTFIHEFGHVLGADDYYDTAYVEHPMNGCDIMDGMTGDHNAYTKFNLGWLTTSRLVVADGSITLTLEDFSKNGDTIIIANNWDPKLGVYQEYYVLVYYTNNGLNSGDEFGYFSRDGIVVYHINASLYSEVLDGETYYDVYNNNTHSSDENGTVNNLIEFVTSSEGNYTYVAGDTLPSVTDDLGNDLAYTFTVDSLTEDYATITFTKG